MRPSFTLFQVASTVTSASSPWQASWLLGQRLATLQKLARATGIPSTGTRKVLAERIGEALDLQSAGRETNAEFEKGAGALSVLSIDMGIQNLAFAHLRVDQPFHGIGKGISGDLSRPKITAWRRLPLSDIATLRENRVGGIDPASKDGSVVDLGLKQASPVTISESGLATESNPSPNSKSKSEDSNSDLDADDEATKKKTPSFDLPHYAETAHTLLHTLVAMYKPTHILIERQRFRSGSSSHVQEWTLRVGLFEAMLYAALEAMKKERGGSLSGVGVYGIDPKRVVQYWGEKEPGFTNVEDGGDKKRKPTSREVKKAKIDTVARWLEAALSETESSSTSSTSTSAHRKIDLLSESSPPRTLAEAYLARLRTGAKRGPKVVPVLKDLTKLDDLADCLLQGVTWVEWIRMRELVLRKGVAAIEES
ncbi:hypothetical protein N7509_003217 [Penicillium cosmopolitanum]|uniref:SAP domain-containing protein n=1 Tax=Penicillium cosmopolitanum TaxID=1131564 RepID=A0A9X0BB52_9EURO|nr:uncharacterized protein N7509_003217 [Penicillium cosmopolitanum]KAJ5403346.1 hypothetical protein N7509_003217 [Penicillium cosmopolitanum]